MVIMVGTDFSKDTRLFGLTETTLLNAGWLMLRIGLGINLRTGWVVLNGVGQVDRELLEAVSLCLTAEFLCRPPCNPFHV